MSLGNFSVRSTPGLNEATDKMSEEDSGMR
jgi:hypothetical protein